MDYRDFFSLFSLKFLKIMPLGTKHYVQSFQRGLIDYSEVPCGVVCQSNNRALP